MLFTTVKGLEAHIEDIMGANGSRENAINLTKLLIEQEFFVLEWDGYHSKKKWDSLSDNTFFELWEKILKK